MNTDILFGRRCGFTTLLVMSGVTKNEDILEMKKYSNNNNNNNVIIPDFYTDTLSDVLDSLTSK